MQNQKLLEQKFFERINHKGKLEEISRNVCRDYNLGDFVSHKLIPIGYEDFNYALETDKGKYFVKVFAKSRTIGECKRITRIIKETSSANVSTPKLHQSNQGICYSIKNPHTQLQLCVLEYVDGKTIHDLHKPLTKKEIQFIARQAARINTLHIKPSFIYDEWAIPHFLREYRKKGKYLNAKDRALIDQLITAYKKLKLDTLPHAFVHGDILTTNIIKDTHRRLWIVDFSVANYYPRIQELAVLACNPLFDEKNKDNSEYQLQLALKEYQKIIPLTRREQDALPTYIKLAHAMHLLSANYQKVVMHNVSEENIYFLNQGRNGLKQMGKS